MPRPSKLSETQWEEIKDRLARGEGVRALAKEYNVSPASISSVSKRAKAIKDVANQIVKTEQNLRSFSLIEQRSTIVLANELMAISLDLTKAGAIGAKNSLRLQSIASNEIEKVDMDNDREGSIETLKGVNVLTRMANESANIGLGLLSANKDRINQEKVINPSLEDMSDEELMSIINAQE